MYNDDSLSYDYNIDNNRKTSSKKIWSILIVLIIIIIVALIIWLSNMNYRNSYEYYERVMIDSARDYVKNNNVSISNKIYIDVVTLGLNTKDNCNVASGVIIENGYYKAYLSCNDYTSSVVDNKSDNIKLKGKEVILLPKTISYVEPGYNSNKNVIVNNTVGTEEGVYDVYYNIIDNDRIIETITRKVIIVDNKYIESLYPSISLNGESIVYLDKGSLYNELGVSAVDMIDGDISSRVTVDGMVNSDVVGEYSILYAVTNSKGYSRNIERKIVIVDDDNIVVTDIMSPTNLTNGEVRLALDIRGDKYSYTILPDKSISYLTVIAYTFDKNGTYDFYFYDINGKMTIKTYNITNISKEAPKGTCVATMYRDRTEISVSATSTNQISGYQYVLDSFQTNYLSNSNYVSNVVEPNKIMVNIKDSINNIANISCSVEKKMTRKIYVNQYGKNCLEGYTCYVQGNYWSTNYKFCSTQKDGVDLCGPISQTGCSITSMTTAVSVFDKRDTNGEIYTPYTLLREVYNKVCSSSCSGWTAFQRAANKVGLSSTEVYKMNNDNADTLRGFLKNGPVIIHANTGPYTSGMHLMALLDVDENGLVYLYNPGGTTTSTLKTKYKDDSWVTISELISGEIDEFMAIGPSGLYSNRNFPN